MNAKEFIESINKAYDAFKKQLRGTPWDVKIEKSGAWGENEEYPETVILTFYFRCEKCDKYECTFKDLSTEREYTSTAYGLITEDLDEWIESPLGNRFTKGCLKSLTMLFNANGGHILLSNNTFKKGVETNVIQIIHTKGEGYFAAVGKRRYHLSVEDKYGGASLTKYLGSGNIAARVKQAVMKEGIPDEVYVQSYLMAKNCDIPYDDIFYPKAIDFNAMAGMIRVAAHLTNYDMSLYRFDTDEYDIPKTAIFRFISYIGFEKTGISAMITSTGAHLTGKELYIGLLEELNKELKDQTGEDEKRREELEEFIASVKQYGEAQLKRSAKEKNNPFMSRVIYVKKEE